MLVFKKSENFKSEYSAKIVRIPEIHHIEGTDKLGVCYINGYSIVVDDTETKPGDVMVYCCNETKLNSAFLAANNQFRNINMNIDPYAKCGYFDDNCRVKNIKLKGTYSWGVLFNLEALNKWTGTSIPSESIDNIIDIEFDCIDIPVAGENIINQIFCEPYIPEQTMRKHSGGGNKNKSQKKIERFDRMEPGQFRLHYDTTPIANVQGIFDKDTSVAISVKVHGTSGIFANVLTRTPIKRNFISRCFVNVYNWLSRKTNGALCGTIDTYTLGYGNVYSSRKIIKNKTINENVGDGFYGSDIWADVNNIIKDFIPEGFTVYGEIVGYTENGKSIQKGYDYGCKLNDDNKPIFKFMPYRITETNKDGEIVKDYDMDFVIKFTEDLISKLPDDKKKYVEKIPMLYNGTVADLLRIPMDSDMNRFEISEKLVLGLKKMFGMESNEPLCINKVPREGIVVRINNDQYSRAFKLKAEKFLVKESKAIDSGDVDIEMEEAYDASNDN